MIAIITSLLPFALNLVNFILTRNAQIIASKEAFLKFVQAMAQDGLISTELHQSYQAQHDKNIQETGSQNKTNN